MKPLKKDDKLDVSPAPVVEEKANTKPVDPQDITYSLDDHSADFDDGIDNKVVIQNYYTKQKSIIENKR